LENIYNKDDLFNMMKASLQDFNVEFVDLDELHVVDSNPAELWSLIDPPKSSHGLAELNSQYGRPEGYSFLPFDVRYQLEVCISREIINEHNINRDFVTTLAGIASEDPIKARNILEYVTGLGKRVFDPMTIFANRDAMGYSPKSEIPHYCAYAKKATVTPSTVYFSTPAVEITNRILRHYALENLEGRFLRVQFTDELAEVCPVFWKIFLLLKFIGTHKFLCRQAT
jgi:RNA-dependent RNA polymerase